MSLCRVLASVILLQLAVVFPSAAQGFLHTNGTKIVNGQGQEVLLRGIGLGGWLVPEGYMLKTPGTIDSPSRIRAAIVDLIGEAGADEFFRIYRANYVTRKDIDRIAQWGFNSIRLPMHYDLLTPRNQPGVYTEAGFATIDSLLSWCEANHLYLILDLHCAPGGQNSGNISDYDSYYPSLWQDASNQSRTVDLWKKLAERYATKQWIGGYDLLNETNWDLGANNQLLRDLFVNTTAAIRQVDTNHIVFAEGNNYATNFNGLTPPWDGNMVYSFHKYWNTNDQGSINGYLSLRSTYGVPLWLGESGENSNTWFTECVSLMENNKIGWAWWPHKKIENIAGPLSAVKTAEYDYVLKYWAGQVTRPTVDYAKSALYGQADRLQLDLCTFQPDVIDALFRQVASDTRMPYTTNDVPGIVYAANYDMGRRNTAYGDVDYQNTGNGAAWNSGWWYRNDGVDIERSSDLFSGGSNVGWINSGEFLTWTVNVAQAGTYSIGFRTAANATGGKIRLSWDGIYMGGAVDVPSTGGWQNWQTVDLGQYVLNAGSHVFRATFLFGGYNASSFEFTQVPTAVKEEPRVVTEYALRQNYPNPFNPSTSIRYDIPREGHVTLEVCNTLGEVLARLVDEHQTPGSHAVEFDGSRFASGIYFYRLSTGSFTQVRKMALVK